MGDVRVVLSRGGGAGSVLVDRPVDGTAAFCTSRDVRVLLDDEGEEPVESSCASGDGPAFPAIVYRPGDPPAPLLDAFDGLSAAATWGLEVSDLSAGGVGTLEAWCLVPRGARPFADGFESGDTTAWSSSSP